MNRLVPILVLLCAGEAAKACTERQNASQAGRAETGIAPGSEGGRVANLPYARGKTFGTLDEYLAHLERQGAIDLPWWREVAPGLYERVARMPGRRPERATRAELMRRYGFRR